LTQVADVSPGQLQRLEVNRLHLSVLSLSFVKHDASHPFLPAGSGGSNSFLAPISRTMRLRRVAFSGLTHASDPERVPLL